MVREPKPMLAHSVLHLAFGGNSHSGKRGEMRPSGAAGTTIPLQDQSDRPRPRSPIEKTYCEHGTIKVIVNAILLVSAPAQVEESVAPSPEDSRSSPSALP
jgi:hypothetical protein